MFARRGVLEMIRPEEEEEEERVLGWETRRPELHWRQLMNCVAEDICYMCLY